jgi:acyl-CoA synthetase (AMP-forming)/AMP-acid ligase II/thioesterase domain-containing protein
MEIAQHVQQSAIRPSAGSAAAVVGRPLREVWRAVVRDRGDVIAVCDCDGDGGQLTHQQVDAHSGAVAAQLRNTPVVSETAPIAVLLGQEPWSAVALIATLKVGRPALTLDPSVPLDRLTAILTASGAEIILTTGKHLEIADELRSAAVVDMLAVDTPGASAVDELDDWSPHDPEDVYGITFTSGSTGAPKGVGVRYTSIMHEVAHRMEADWTRPEDQVGLVMPLSFGAARGELNSSLLLGSTVHLFDPRTRGPGPMPAWLDKHRITVIAATPSLLTAVVRTLPDGEGLAGSLRMVRSSGEKVLCSEALSILRRLPPECRLINAFGSSEATMISAYEITAATPDIPKPVPAGWPIRDREIRLEREDGTEPAAGEVGEVIVVSGYLPAGYWRDEVRTSQKYALLPDGRTALATGDLGVALPDGSFRLAGRKDMSVKIRGNLVEPAEVEGALLSCEGIRECVVIGRPTATGRERLIAYPVLHLDAEIVRPADLRRQLRRTLPTYMIPESFVFLTELPRNERGKLDLKVLPNPPEHAVPLDVRDMSPWEQHVAELWAQVLQLEAVGLDDDFFDLGGDSLSAEELMARLSDLDALDVDSRVLLDASTVAEFAAAVQALSAAPASALPDRLVPIRRTGTRPPLFCVAGAGRLGMTYLPLARRLDADQPVWALQASGREQRKFVEWSVRQMSRNHLKALRTVQPHGPYLLAGHSFGAVLAFDIAHQLRAAGEKVALLVCLDSFPPHPREMPSIRHHRSLAQWRTTISNHLKLTAKAPMGEASTEVYIRQSRVVSQLYRGRPYAGRTLVVVAGDDQGKPARGMPWARYLSGGWTLRETPGIHATMLNEPHVETLADFVQAAIDRALD